jgi:hypothetical protein
MMKNWQLGALLGVIAVGLYLLFWFHVITR